MVDLAVVQEGHVLWTSAAQPTLLRGPLVTRSAVVPFLPVDGFIAVADVEGGGSR
jgi:hypothetical protein